MSLNLEHVCGEIGDVGAYCLDQLEKDRAALKAEVEQLRRENKIL